MDVFLTRGPDAGVKLAEQEPVVPGLPAVHHFVRVRLVHSVVYTLVRPQLAALRLGDSLGAHAPVSRYERGYGEKQREEVQADRQKGPAPASRLHCPREGWTVSGARRTGKFMGAKWTVRTSTS